MRLIRQGAKRQVIAKLVIYARTLWDQLRGLIGRSLPPEAALLLPNCPQVHTAFLRYSITVAFARRTSESTWLILHRETLSPWRVSRWVSGAALAIEMPADSLLDQLNPGDTLLIEEVLPD